MLYSFKKYVKPEIIENHLNLGGSDNKGNTLSINSQTFMKNGVPYMGIMGEIHFSRVPRSQWREALNKMKEGGITIIATYIIWIYHELNEGSMDWSGDNDLRAFVELCHELGLEVCLRVGPWVHGEVRNGGLPDWLLKKPCELRSLDPKYMKLVTGWYQAVADQVKGLMYKDGGPITMCQVENELVDNAEYLLALKKVCKEVGIDVPFYTVTGWNSAAGARIPVDDVIPTFGGYCDAPWDSGTEKQEPCSRYFFTGIRNDSAIGKDLIKAEADADGWQLPYEHYPYATCEIGGGLMNTYHRRYIIKGMDVYAMSLIILCEGANLMGYYMYHGGINKVASDYTLQESKDTGYPNDYPMISYDFQAPLSSYEEKRESYDLLNMLHLFIHDYQEKLALMTYVEAEKRVERTDMSSLRYGMRTDGSSGFVFVNHYQRLHNMEDVLDVEIDTGLGVKFPAIDVKGDIAFFMPFNMEMGEGVVLEYATAQPLCRDGRTWIFAEIPGIEPRYKFAKGDCDIVTITWKEALRLRKVDGIVFKDEEIRGISENFTMTEMLMPAFEIPAMYKKELDYQNKPAKWYYITTNTDKGFINIDLKCDVMQLYVDGKLVEDDFYHSVKWRLPNHLIYGHQCYIVASEYQDKSYME